MRARHLLTLSLVLLAGAAKAQVQINDVTSVEVKDEGTRVAIVIQGTRPPNFTTFSMADPPRFVIDLSESRFVNVPPDINVEDGFINVIKNLSYGSDLTSIARVMVAFAVEVDPPETPETTGNTLIVRFAKPAGSASIAKAEEADRRAKEEAEAKARAEAEAKARAEADAKARADAEAKAQAEAQAAAELKARQDQEAADARAKAEQERKERELADAKAAEEAAAQAAAEARARETKEKAEVAASGGAPAGGDEDVLQQREPQVSKAEQERLAKEQAAAEKKAAAERKAQELADAKAKAEEEKRAREEERRAKLDAEKLAKEEAAAAKRQAAEDARLAKEQAAAEKKAAAEQAAAERKAKAEEARLAREQAAADRKAEAERKRQEAADAKARAKEERLAKLEAEKAEREAARAAAAERLATSGTAPVARLKEIGFKQMPGTSRVFVRTDVVPRFTVQDVGENVVRVEFENTRVARRNDTRFMDTSFFPSAVAMITPSRVGGSYVVEIKLKQRVPYQQKIEGETFSLDFERPAAPAAAEPSAPAGAEPGAEAAPGSAPEDAGEPPAEELK